jgi:hypothetical protein
MFEIWSNKSTFINTPPNKLVRRENAAKAPNSLLQGKQHQPEPYHKFVRQSRPARVNNDGDQLTSLATAPELWSFALNFSSVASCLAMTSAAATALFNADERKAAAWLEGANAATDDDVTKSTERLHKRRILLYYYLNKKGDRK